MTPKLRNIGIIIIIKIVDVIYVTKCNIKRFLATVETSTVIEQRLDTNKRTNNCLNDDERPYLVPNCVC